MPSLVPSEEPSAMPSRAPSREPTYTPTYSPTEAPTPTPAPSISPIPSATYDPTPEPTMHPTHSPSHDPTMVPIPDPSAHPTESPSAAPTNLPSIAPTEEPTAAPTGEPSAIFFSAGTEETGTKLYKSRVAGGSLPVELDTDTSSGNMLEGCTTGMVDGAHLLFFTDMSAGTVNRMTFDGTDRETLVSGLPYPRAISISHGGDYMYWTGTVDNSVMRAKTNGDKSKTLVSGIAGVTDVEAVGKFVYFTSVATGNLYRMDGDGDHLTVLVHDLKTPMGIVYLPGEPIHHPWTGPATTTGFKNGWLYVLTTKAIIRMTAVGTQIETIVEGINDGYGLGLDIPNGRLLFSDYNSTGIYKSGLMGEGVQLIVAESNTRALCFYASSEAGTFAPSGSPSLPPTPIPSVTYSPTATPSPPPTRLPTARPTLIMDTIIFSAGSEDQGVFLFKYTPKSGGYTRLSGPTVNTSFVTDIAVSRITDSETMVYFVDGYNDALFRTTLDGPADSLPTALVKGCYSASSLTIPHGQSYVYMACNG